MVSYSSLLTRSPPSGGFMECHWIILPAFLYVWKKIFFLFEIFYYEVLKGEKRHQDIWPRFCLGEHAVGISQFRHKHKHSTEMWCHLCRLAFITGIFVGHVGCKSGTLQKLLPMCFRVLTRRWQCVGEDVCSTRQFRLHSARELWTQSLGPVFSSFSYVCKGNYCSNTT